MKEADWLACQDPGVMLRWATGKGVESAPASVSDRKLRLFACACCLMTGARPERVNGYERDGYALTEQPWTDWQWASQWCGGTPKVSQKAKCDAIRDIIGNPFRPVSLWSHQWQEMFRSPLIQSLALAAYEERDRECPYCKDAKFDRGNLGDNLMADHIGRRMAKAAAQRCACKGTRRMPREDGSLCPVRLAILADALEECGIGGVKCPRHDIPGSLWPDDICPDCNGAKVLPCPLLAHLRSPGPHWRGMWSLDTVLGRE